jgi:phage terminase Nu1 subunit (DNA packaging protein)
MKLEKLSQMEVAELLTLSTRQVRNLEAEGMPVHARAGKKWYVWREVLEWDRERKEAAAREAATPDPEEPDSLLEAERRKAIADAKIAEMKEQQMRRALIAEADAEAEITRFCDRVRASILSIRSRHQAEILNLQTIPDAGRALERIVAAVLTDLQREAGGARELEDLELAVTEANVA